MSRCGEQEERFDMRRTYDLPKAVDQNVRDKGKVDNILRRPEVGFQKNVEVEFRLSVSKITLTSNVVSW